jgi:HAD superfamily hydrolase (TIGR01509 family)
MTAVIFDLDGVLVDSVPLWDQAWAVACARLGVEYPFTFAGGQSSVNGMSAAMIAKRIAENTQVAPEALHQAFNEAAEPLWDQATLNPGVLETLDQLRLRCRTGVGSSAPKAYVDFILDKFGLREHIDAIATCDMVEHAKPAPDIFLKAAELMGIPPRECVVVEDAAMGIKAAKAAGMKTVALLNPGVTLLDMHEADTFVGSLEEVNQGLLDQLFGGA